MKDYQEKEVIVCELNIDGTTCFYKKWHMGLVEAFCDRSSCIAKFGVKDFYKCPHQNKKTLEYRLVDKE